MQSAVPRVLAIARARPLPRTPTGRRRRGARRGLRARQPGPHLRHPGRDRRRLARLARRRAERGARPPLDLLADRRARHADGRAGPPRRAHRARRRRDRRPLPDGGARARRAGSRGTRPATGRDEAAGAPQPRLLGWRRLVGAGPGAHSHVGGVRWWNVLHPRAGANGSRPARPPRPPARPRATRGPPRARDARAAPAVRRRRWARSRRWAARRPSPTSPTGSSTFRPRVRPRGPDLRGRLLADPVTIDLAA